MIEKCPKPPPMSQGWHSRLAYHIKLSADGRPCDVSLGYASCLFCPRIKLKAYYRLILSLSLNSYSYSYSHSHSYCCPNQTEDPKAIRLTPKNTNMSASENIDTTSISPIRGPLERRNSLEKHLVTRPETQDLKNRHILLDTTAAP
jgi:hypothetical protein